ncbi:transmembrane protein 26-like [Mya arenaria]|uniref:transmembrane protein 26-like n=1 Tax=Mya arenaria TaxID=6604 RepID=UPI0022E70232|nr:transmembrane protein 26-like [Mya arenaria]XP_052787944.1 transmembrane protein 26-like [Mya arenaria]
MKAQLVFDVLKAVAVRLVLLVHSLLVIWLAASITHRKQLWLLAIVDLGMLVEAVFTVGKNKAQEWKWFCPCFLFYLMGTVPGIWILELNRMYDYQDRLQSNGTSQLRQKLEDIQGLEVPIELETDTWVVIMEQLFLYLMILGRWALPRGEITRGELSQLLFVFIGIASDITELFALFEENTVRKNTGLTYAILCIWSISLLQFTFVLTSTHSPRKAVAAAAAFTRDDEDEEAEVDEGCVKHVFQTEVWSICVNFLFQDGPFLAVRLYAMIALKILTYSIIFFTAKNALLVMLLVYRLSVLCCERKRKVANGSGSENDVSREVSKQSLSKLEQEKARESIVSA